jgi:NADPH:quinone reductase-like Zn-dependent oxidoreductase
MKAVIYNQFGGPHVLSLTELPKPVLKASEAIIRVQAISLNPRDTSLREGTFKFFSGSQFPKLTGADFSGVIEEIGENKQGFQKGDEVFGYVQDLKRATSATYVSLPIKYLASKPSSISHQQAASLGCAYLTALQALRDKARIEPGERVLIYGAAGGVGTAAIQLAKYYGAHVTAVSKSTQREYCLSQGADTFIAYDKQEVFSAIHEVDVFFQVYSKGGTLYNKAKKIMSPPGHFICLVPNPLFLFRKIFSRPAFDYLLVKNSRADLELLGDLTAREVLKPYFSKQFTLNEIMNAYKIMENGNVQGKIVVCLHNDE